MIFVREFDTWMEPRRASSLLVPAAPGRRVRDCLSLRGPNVRAWRNGRPAELDELVESGDRLHACPVPGEQILVYAVTLLLAAIVQAMLAPPLPARRRDDDDSPVYGFSGPRSSRVEGSPIPFYLGCIMAGGQVVSERVYSRGALGDWYEVIISFGYGPIQSIAGVSADTDPDLPLRSGAAGALGIPETLFINDTKASEYEGIEMHVRLGSNEQLPMPGFDFDSDTISVDAELEQGDASSAGSVQYAVSQLSPGTSEDSTWAAYGNATSVTSRQIDAFTAKVLFPGGVYAASGSGGLSYWGVSLAVRYIELDSGGSPITTGGPHGDGWVRLRPTPEVALRVQGQVGIDWQFTLYDPQSFSLPALSRIAKFNANETFQEVYCARGAGLNLPVNWTPASALPEVSLEGWAVLRPNGSNTGQNSTLGIEDSLNTKDNPLIDWLDTTLKRGFRLSLGTRTFQLSPGNLRTRIVPIVAIGDGSVVREYYERNLDGAAGASASELGEVSFRMMVWPTPTQPSSLWSHVACTYKADVLGTQDRLRIFADGELVAEVVGELGMVCPAAAQPFYVGRRSDSSGANQVYFKGYVDEFVVWNRELSPLEVQRSYASGRGLSHLSGSDVVAGYHWDENPAVSGTGQAINDFGPLGNGLTSSSTGIAATFSSGALSGFIDKTTPSNVPKRSWYRVEIMRATLNVNSATVVDDYQLAAIITHRDAPRSFPGSPLLGLRIKAHEQLSGEPPQVKAILEGLLLPVWDGASASSPNFEQRYSRNPAWGVLGYVLSANWGLGAYFSARDIPVQEFQELADYSAELIYNLRGERQAVSDTSGSAPIFNLAYDGAAYGGLGRISIVYRNGFAPPSWLREGAFVGFVGLNSPATNPTRVFQDCNVSAIDGFLVRAVTYNGGWTVDCQYRKNASSPFADPPWGGAGDFSLALNGASPAMGGTMEGREERFLLDIAVDAQGGAWDLLLRMLASARSIPCWDGRRLGLRINRARAAVDILGQASMLPGTFSIDYEQSSQKINARDADFLDADLNYERSQVPYEHPSVAESTDLSKVRRESVFLDGVCRRSQAYRHIAFLTLLELSTSRVVEFTADIDALPIGLFDVVQVAHDIVPRGRSFRVRSASDASHVALDRALVLEAATTYVLAVRPESGPHETAVVSSAAGSYAAGAELALATPLSAAPARGQAAILCEQGAELLVAVRHISLTQDLQRRVSAALYDPSIFDIDESGTIPDLPLDLVTEDAPASSARALPANVEGLRVEERVERAAGGAHRSSLALSWAPGLPAIAREAVLFLARGRGPWEERGRARVQAGSAEVRLDDAAPGTVYRVAVQPISPSGARRPPDLCSRRSLTVYGLAPTPAAPLSASAQLSGEGAVYSWVPGARGEASSHELRRGGWILGQPVAAAPHGASSLGPTRDWASAQANAAGRSAPPLLLRARSEAGKFSQALDLAWAPAAGEHGLEVVVDLPASALSSLAWEDWEDGWISDSPLTPNSTLSDLQRLADGSLGFLGSALSGTWESPLPECAARDAGRRDLLVHASAFAEAEQVFPLAWQDMGWGWDSPGSQWTWEGPIDELGDAKDPGRCSLALWVRFLHVDGSLSAWEAYRPGLFPCIAAQWQLRASRPSAAFDVRIRRFSTQLVRPARHPEWSTGGEAFRLGRIQRRGSR